MQGSLVIGMSSCQGWWGGKMAMSDEGHPFYALVGSSGDADWSDAAVAFVALYHRLFKGAEMEEAVAAMRAASGDQSFDYWWGAPTREKWRQHIRAERIKDLTEKLGALDLSRPPAPGPHFRPSTGLFND